MRHIYSAFVIVAAVVCVTYRCVIKSGVAVIVTGGEGDAEALVTGVCVAAEL
jgi:hypothetical protein